ncbi:MAG: hypothetical protein EHM42_10510, partial [Planctomycetaceae bacterium]
MDRIALGQEEQETMIDFIGEFSADQEFRKLLGRRDDEVNLTIAALELARDANSRLDFTPTLQWIAARGAEISGLVALASGDQAILRVLADCLCARHGITGNSMAYDSADGSYLNRVIETRNGIPISLSVLYLAVAECAGIALRGVCAPGHFLVRYETLHKPLFIDAFHKGRVLTFAECLERVQSEHQMTKAQARRALEPAGPRAIITRMLNNLKAIHAHNENWTQCFKTQNRLLALQPAAYSERRDWALIALKAGKPGPALTML